MDNSAKFKKRDFISGLFLNSLPMRAGPDVLSQFRRMANAAKNQGKFKPKHAMHLVRLLYSGIAALETGEIPVDVSERRDELLDIRNGSLTFDEVKEKALGLEREFQQAFEMTTLPDQPDYAQVNEFLIWARRSMVDD